MEYMKKNVNVALLLLIVLIVAAFAGVSSYYQGTYKNLSKNYDVKLGELSVVEGNLSQKENILGKTKQELDLRTEDKAKFEAMYGNLSDERDRIAKDLADTEEELDSTKSTLDSTRVALEYSEGQVVELESDVGELQAIVKQKKELITSLESQLCTFNQSYC